ncbi:MAG: phospholipid carrier-dependent glycosyltransferase [Candidatus Bathyarchaeota archaeon]|nr:phospholipid carrier-dependent glycosyltransferase [Candidatus Bathyarchaeota archaeon]
MDITRRDLLTVTVLCVVFFTVASWQLGATAIPITTAQFSAGQSFYVDLESSTTVKSVIVLLKDGSFNLTLSTGSPISWQPVASNIAFPYNSALQQWSKEYCKWYEISIQQTTRYIKFTINPSPYYALVAEIAAVDENNQQIPIASISNIDSVGSLQSLIDEQDKVQYPLTYVSQTYFDEIYFVQSAEQYLHLQVPMEWTHPPLGKLIQAAGIAILGYNPFGWRIIGVLFATLMIPVMYFLGKKLLGTWIGAFASAFLLTFDFMHFTMGRIGTADTYLVFFSLLSQFFFLSYLLNVVKEGWKTPVLPLFLAVLFFALGFSTKWLVLYGFAGQLAILAAIRLREIRQLKDSLRARVSAFFNHPFAQLYYFLLLAVLIYFVTFIPDMLAGRTFTEVFQLQFSMYNYHSTLSATHAFSSQWWSWPLILRPVWFFVSHLPNGAVSTIAAMGNPAVWWVGFAFVIFAAEDAVRKRSLACIFISTLFLFQWLPYVLISRVTFLYHFYVNVPILCLATAYFLNAYWSSKWGKIAAIAYFTSVVILFGLFYPVISGAPVSDSWINSLKWLGSWVF